MAVDKTVIIGTDGLPDAGSPEDGSRHTNPTTQRFTTIVQETAHVTSDKIVLDEKELEILPKLDDLYELGKSFAEGGQGVIHTGRDKFLKRFVALKALKSKLLSNKQVVANFVAEAKITSQLDHPSIIPLYGMLSQDGGGLGIAMKLVHGQTLNEVLDDIDLSCRQHSGKPALIKGMLSRSLRDNLEVFVKTCDAVSFAHERGVIHRDLKPDNIMVGPHHEVYVMDWGVACLDANTASATPDNSEIEDARRSSVSGTPGFIAPEVVVGGYPSHFSDQYSLGVILFEIATLRSPVVGANVQEVFENTRDGNLAPIKHAYKKHHVNKDLKAIVRKAMALDPKDRYPSVEDLANDIRRFIANAETTARPDNLPRKVARWMTNHRNKALAIFMLVLLSMASVAIYNLMEKNKAIAESKKRALKRVEIHSSIERDAHFIDTSMLHVAGVLSRIADRLADAMKDRTKPATNYPAIYATSAFATPTPPPGTVFAPAYNQKVNFKLANYKLAPGLPLKEAEPTLKSISPLVPTWFKYLADSRLKTSDSLPPLSRSELEKIAMNQGFPVVWAYLGTAKGLLINYPGSGSVGGSYDPRKRPWYKIASTSRRVCWTPPYYDAFGMGVIVSASKAIWDGKKLLGVASVDVTLSHFKTLMLTKTMSRHGVLEAYLVDQAGRVVLSRDVGQHSLEKAKKTLGEVKFAPFPYPELKTEIKRRDSGQFEVTSGSKTLLVGYAPVPTLSCYLVEVLDFDIYMKTDE